ncbi:MAG TPA: hypothetical protein PKV42_01480 [Thiobacillus sp.]|jgi:hypothetical protein|nr:MAG: hypothetical protein B7Y27_06710 [Hydrogenophilales bacterium 16-64-40]OZA32282.1 MAG: hypothetical protein B7X82_13565 [Hydrogenophilales bacterium 17-64-65]HQS81106.1 hypothetical protein [Thiobacillus sp.]HQT32792.1 hypothetical protein [Thiobacillus sp.]
MTSAATDLRNADPHPAAQWSLLVGFNPEQADCTTAVVLKILDNKCKMLPGEKLAVMAIYDAVRHLASPLFECAVHDAIRAARQQPGTLTLEAVHPLRVHAEAAIPKPVMKRYKAFLRDGLFG